MKLQLLTLLILVNIFTSYAQNNSVEIKKSEIFKDKGRDSRILFYDNDSEGRIVLTRLFYDELDQLPKLYVVEYYNTDLKLVSSASIKVEKRRKIKEMFVKDKKVYLIESFYDNSSNVNQIHYNILSSNKNKLEFTSKNLFSIPRENIVPTHILNENNIDLPSGTEVNISDNKNYISFVFDVNVEKKATHLIKVYTTDFQEVYEHSLALETKDKFFEYNSSILNENNGTIYILGKLFHNNSLKEKKNGKPNYSFQLYKIDENSEEKLSLKTEDKFISSLEMLLKNDQLVLAGVYSEKNNEKVSGIAYFNIDPNKLNLKANTYNKFSTEFLVNKNENPNRDFENLLLKGIYLTDKNDLIFTAEEFCFIEAPNYGPNRTSNTRNIYHFNNIICAKIDASGEMKWWRNIYKRQSTSRKDYHFFSFLTLLKNEEINLFVNAREFDDFEERIELKSTNPKRMNLYKIALNAQGELNYQTILDEDITPLCTKPLSGVTDKDVKTIILEGSKRLKTQIIKLSL
ncbi:hypothetical protein [Mesonia maritima]|uniref:6-bladed beta-propeller protein n=1 Tax=Mesonia maritima TaxID=1793873 RepID=A0ABU1K346_9FLAO|nr:hypothetical protein [Mesonia maritima]MDR6299680.1 hypothetical protein [Mesonia maritima]